MVFGKSYFDGAGLPTSIVDDQINLSGLALSKECLQVKGSFLSVETQAKLVDIFSHFGSS